MYPTKVEDFSVALKALEELTDHGLGRSIKVDRNLSSCNYKTIMCLGCTGYVVKLKKKVNYLLPYTSTYKRINYLLLAGC